MLFSTVNAAKLTGASVRQIDHWARTGLLKPSGRGAVGKGSRRRYTFVDLVALMTVVQLRKHGCPLQKIRKAVIRLCKDYPNDSTPEALANLTLLTDGKKVYLLQDEHEVMEVVTRQSVWSVALGRLIQQVKKRVDKLPLKWDEPVKIKGQTFNLQITRDVEYGGYIVQCRELPGALEQGQTVDEAKSNGIAAIKAVLDYRSRQRTGRGSTKRAKKAG